MKFKVGDKVKLKSATDKETGHTWPDWRKSLGQWGIIKHANHIGKRITGYPYLIQWPNGETSAAPEWNIEKQGEESAVKTYFKSLKERAL